MKDRVNIPGTYEIDVEKVLDSKNPGLRKRIPAFIISYLKRIVHQEEINAFLREFGNLKDSEFIEAGLRQFEITYKVYGRENLPGVEGRYIFVSNHPLGGLDGLVFIYELSKYYNNIKFPVNDILTNIENLSGIFLPINKHGSQGREAALKLEEAYSSDCQMLYFPAGLCSRKRRGIIKDLQWQKSFISKAVRHKRDIVPAFFSGRNSNFFYNLANIRKLTGIQANIEMLYLADEMFRQKNKKILLAFGKPIPWQTFDRTRNSLQWADWIRSRSYELESMFID
jgi:1-acyl-sn-glycerol-3-phosphate acyltransferase